jgi:hypothetical protein
MRHGDGWSAIALAGVVDERSDLRPLADAVRGQVVVLDTSAVRRINSVGVREWVLWMNALRAAGQRVVLIDCSPAVMDQVNLVQNFAEGAVVASFLAPYYCDRCDLEQLHRIETPQIPPERPARAPRFTCGKPGCALSFDDVEQDFFSFLEDHPEVEDPEALARMVAAAREALAEEGPLTDQTGRGADDAIRGAPSATDPDTDGDRSTLADVAFVGVVVVLGGLLAALVYLMLTLE